MLLQKWSKNIFDTKDNAYETPIIAYSRKLDVLVPSSFITRSDVEEENYPPYSKDVVMDSKKERMNSEDTALVVTPQFAIGSNELINPPMALDLVQYVQKKVWQHILNWQQLQSLARDVNKSL
jgi:hypothetical protein